MTPTRYLLVVVAVLVAGSLVVPTMGFSSASTVRNVDVAVVSDDDAYLTVERDCSNGTVRVTVTNRFPTKTTADLDITVNGTTRTVDGLAPGDRETRRFDTYATDDTITITVSGPGVSARLTRSVPARC